MHLDTFKQDNYSTVGGDEGCRASEVQMGVVVQWLDYFAVTQEPGVRFPATAEKCHLMWRCPSGHGINYA